MAACDDGNPGSGNSPSVNTSLNGTWVDGGFEIKISGSTGVYTRLPSDTGSALWNDAKAKGYLKVGTQYYRNISQTGTLTWSAQKLAFGWTGNPNVADGRTSYTNCTITMSSDGRTIYEGGGSATRR